jgi:3-dehydrosphinganine reductase
MITGGSSGIGLAVAEVYLRLGNNVSLIARDAGKLEAAKQKLSTAPLAENQKILCVSADVAIVEEVNDAVSQAVAALGTPEKAIMSAGIVDPGYFSELDLLQFETNMAVNYFGSLYVAKALLPHLQAAGKGHLVFISSAAGLMGIFGYSAYGPTKFAVRGLAEILRMELKSQNIKVSVVYPSDTDTPQYQAEIAIRPEETNVVADAGGIWSAENMAKFIVKKVAREKFLIAPGWQIYALARLHSLIHPILNAWFDFLIKIKCQR